MFLFFCRWVVLPLLQTNCNFAILLHLIPMLLVEGFYPAFFIVQSHNFKGVYMVGNPSKKNERREESFVHRQVKFLIF